MGAMHPEDRQAVAAGLIDARADLAARITALDRTLGELVDAADLEPPDDEHDPDGTTAYERAQVISLAREGRARLRAIDRALGDIDGPDFGRCEACGGEIGAPRLLAVPETRRCVRCAGLDRRPPVTPR